jgi:hypothetical protein
MTEFAAPSPPARDRLGALQLAGIAAGAGLIVAGALTLARSQVQPVAVARVRPAEAHTRLKHHEPDATAQRPAPSPAALAAQARIAAMAARLAAAGFARDLFTESRNRELATAARVAAYRPLIVQAARRSGFSPNVLEGIAFVETARGNGFARARARSRNLASMIRRTGAAASLRRTMRYLVTARRSLGRGDLAIASYGMGVGRLRGVIAGWAGSNDAATSVVRKYRLSYAELYFSSAPDRHAAAWLRLKVLEGHGDYYWKVVAAERLMRLYRHDRHGLLYQERLQARKNSAEEVLHPFAVTARFRSPSAIALALRHHVLRAIPTDSRETHVVVSGTVGQEAHRLGRSRRLYRALRPDALAVLLYIGRRVHELSASRPLIVTSAVRDLRYQRVLTRHNSMATHSYSMHTTGYAFDIARSYGSLRERAAFQFVLDRLQALNLIAYIREPDAIHIAVASHAAARLRTLRGDL